MNPNTQTGEPAEEPAEQQKTEQAEEKIDLKAKLEEFLDKLSYEERNLIKECKWEKTDKKWTEGFLEFIEKRVGRAGNFGMTMFKDFVKNLRRDYENTSSIQDPEGKKLLKAQYYLAEKMFGFYTGEKSPEKKKEQSNKEKIKGIYSKENIMFTLRNIRRQIFALFGMKDPWWDYSREQKGTGQIEAQGFKTTQQVQPPQHSEASRKETHHETPRHETPRHEAPGAANDNARVPSAEHPDVDKAA